MKRFIMKNEVLVYSLSFVAFLLLLFLGANITGFIIYKAEYNDLCKDDNNCFDGKQCCIIYPENSLGLCMKDCMSYQFLCKNTEECEVGTVCCKPEGKEYGICNKQEKCLDIDVFADYIGKTTFVDPALVSQQKISIPMIEKPINIDSKSIISIQTTLLILLIIALIYLLLKKNKSDA